MLMLMDIWLTSANDANKGGALYLASSALLRTRSPPLLHRHPCSSYPSIQSSRGRLLHCVSLHLLPHLTYVRSILEAGADLSAHIEQISNVALVFDGDNTSEAIAHRSFMPLIQS
jgi:hypothetical protein